MYKQVDKMVPCVDSYQKKLIDEGVISADEAKRMKEKVMDSFEEAYVKSKQHSFHSEEWVTPQWEQIKNLNSDIN